MGLDCHVISQDHMTKDSSNSIGESFKVSHHPTKFGDHRHSSNGDVFSLSRDLARPRDQRVM